MLPREQKISGFQSALMGDMVTHRQINIERFKSGLHEGFDAVTASAGVALTNALANLGVTDLSSNPAAVRKATTIMLAVFDDAAKVYTADLLSQLRGFVLEEAKFFDLAIRRIVYADEGVTFSESSLWAQMSAFIIAASGFNVRQTLANLILDVRRRLVGAVQRATSLRLSVNNLLVGLSGNASLLRRDGLFHKLRNLVSATVDTVFQAGVSVGRKAAMAVFTRQIVGVTWVSVLDAKTSSECRSLSGRTFAVNSGPTPPLHYRCRSSIMPIFSLDFVRNGIDTAFVAGETFYGWLNRQSEALQDSVLGATRGRLFRQGGLTAEQFAVMVLNKRYQPLTLDELRKKNPEVFSRAGL